MLTDSTSYSVNSNTLMYAQKYMDLCYFLEYPLSNTWTYEITFRSLCNGTGRILGFGGRLLLFRELVVALPIYTPHPSSFFMHSQAPRL